MKFLPASAATASLFDELYLLAVDLGVVQLINGPLHVGLCGELNHTETWHTRIVQFLTTLHFGMGGGCL